MPATPASAVVGTVERPGTRCGQRDRHSPCIRPSRRIGRGVGRLVAEQVDAAGHQLGDRRGAAAEHHRWSAWAPAACCTSIPQRWLAPAEAGIAPGSACRPARITAAMTPARSPAGKSGPRHDGHRRVGDQPERGEAAGDVVGQLAVERRRWWHGRCGGTAACSRPAWRWPRAAGGDGAAAAGDVLDHHRLAEVHGAMPSDDQCGRARRSARRRRRGR